VIDCGTEYAPDLRGLSGDHFDAPAMGPRLALRCGAVGPLVRVALSTPRPSIATHSEFGFAKKVRAFAASGTAPVCIWAFRPAFCGGAFRCSKVDALSLVNTGRSHSACEYFGGLG